MKTQHTIILSTLLMYMAGNMTSCGDRCDADCPEIKEAPQEFLDYWYFPKGSWWVYQLEDSTQKIYDTVVVRRSERYYDELKPKCNGGEVHCQSRYETLITHSNEYYFPGRTDETKEWYGLGIENYYCGYNLSKDIWQLWQGSSTYKLHSYETFLKYPFQKDAVYFNESYLCRLNDTFLFRGKTQNMLTVCNDLEPVGDRQFFNELSFAKGVGLVSVTYDHQETWKLIDYHVNP